MTFCQFFISGTLIALFFIELFNNKKGEQNNVTSKMVTH